MPQPRIHRPGSTRRASFYALLAMVLILTPHLSYSEAPPGAAEFRGQCDASAAVTLGDDSFLVADDEDNLLRVYRFGAPGMPVQEWDAGKHILGKAEADIEGACRVGQRLFFITSHGRNKKGESRPERQRFFALDFSSDAAQGIEFRPAGKVYQNLLADFAADPRLRAFHLDEAARLAPKEPGGLNIEALCAMPGGELLIAFRNPIPGGKALLVPLRNPEELIAGRGAAEFGEPVLLDLDGLGVRSLGWHNGQCLIVAGPYDPAVGRSRLYAWKGGRSDPPRRLRNVRLEGFNPEAILFQEGGGASKLWLLSDDGAKDIDGAACKDLKPKHRRFRALAFALADLNLSGEASENGK